MIHEHFIMSITTIMPVNFKKKEKYQVLSIFNEGDMISMLFWAMQHICTLHIWECRAWRGDSYYIVMLTQPLPTELSDEQCKIITHFVGKVTFCAVYQSKLPPFFYKFNVTHLYMEQYRFHKRGGLQSRMLHSYSFHIIWYFAVELLSKFHPKITLERNWRLQRVGWIQINSGIVRKVRWPYQNSPNMWNVKITSKYFYWYISPHIYSYMWPERGVNEGVLIIANTNDLGWSFA